MKPEDVVYRFEGMLAWPHERTPDAQQRGRFTFSAGWADTLSILRRELAYLRAVEVVIGTGHSPRDIRRDGMPRGDRHPHFPGVELSFKSDVNLTPLARRGRELIRKHGGVREAMKATHPDAGGSHEDFAAVNAADDQRRLVYATDTCVLWQHNVRSIALGLEALRAVDRYGITKRGEQYAGFTGALPAGRGA